MVINGNNENVVSITVSPLVTGGIITVYAHSDGAFTEGDGGVGGVSILLVKKAVSPPYIPPVTTDI